MTSPRGHTTGESSSEYDDGPAVAPVRVPRIRRPRSDPDAFALASPRGTLVLRLFALLATGAIAAAVATGVAAETLEPRSVDLLAGLVPVALVAVLAATDRHRRRSWSLLAAALGLVSLGSIWQVLLDPIGSTEPSQSIRIAGVVALTVAIAIVSRSISPGSLRSDRLDGAILVFGVTAGAATIWGGTVEALTADVGTARLAAITVCADLLLAAVVASAVSAMRYRPSTSVLLMAAGAMTLLVADVLQFRFLLDAGTTVEAVATFDPVTRAGVDELRLVGTMLFALAVWFPRQTREEQPERLSRLTVVPVASSLVALVIIATGIMSEVNMAASLLALTALAAVILRTAVTVHELHTGSESYRLARTDELTALTNRRGFLEGLDRLIQVAPLNVAVMIIDLNGFKEVNDSLGHHAGDELLRLVADRFRPVVGQAGLLARLGGDEFGVVIMVPDKHAALDGAAMLQRSLDDAFHVDGLSVRVGAAIGVALYPSQSRTRSGVMRSADVAMYEAKSRRTGVELYHPASDFRTRDKLQLVEDLREAIEHRRLSLYYQPKVGLIDGKITSSEALVRWEHPTRGLLMPDDFVPLAERAGLVPGLTRAVLAQAISFHAERCPHVGVSVNISHRDVVDDDLAVYIADLLQIFGFPAEQLTLEITETELAHDPVRAARSIANLRAAGMRISIDDFGVGYSSMARLLDLRVDEVKIDKSFVFAIADDVRAIAIIRSTVELAAALGLKVVAEGIENAGVLAQVVRAGVDVGQGYVIARPLTGSDYLEFLGARTKGRIEAPKRAPVLPDRPAPPSSGLTPA